MQIRHAIQCLALCILATGARAQLGSTDAAQVARYGEPDAASEPAPGVKISAYSDHGLSIETGSYSGVVRRVIFRRPGLDDPEVSALLVRNRGETDWNEWQPPAGSALASHRKVWRTLMPSTLATLDADTLTLVRADWNNRSEVPEDVATKPANLSATPSHRPPEVVAYKRADMPDELPGSGDTRARVIELLGQPKGAMRQGRNESLFYAWGIIELADGRMVRTR